MINIKRLIAISIATLSLSIIAPVGANAEWRHDNNGWWYSEGDSYLKDCSKFIDGYWYVFDSNGYQKTGWVQDEHGSWHYYYSNGTIATNTIIDGYLLSPRGYYLEGFTKDDVDRYRKIIIDNVGPERLNGFVEDDIAIVKNYAPPGYNIKIQRAIIFDMQDVNYYYDPQQYIVDIDTNKVYLFDTGYNFGTFKDHHFINYEYNEKYNKY